MIPTSVQKAVENHLTDFAGSSLAGILTETGNFAIKFVSSKWASRYQNPSPLKISTNPPQTWGTATYVTPIAYPLSSALYGRIGLVTKFDPDDWIFFDATQPRGRAIYATWARAQPVFQELLLTVHSTAANHFLRNQFRKQFKIDCVLFHPDQEAELHTDLTQHVWMAVTDFSSNGEIETDKSPRLSKARFTVLIDEEFATDNSGLPVKTAPRLIEATTSALPRIKPVGITTALSSSTLPVDVVTAYSKGGYLHVYIEP